jgi:two-component system response regulator FlrC
MAVDKKSLKTLSKVLIVEDDPALREALQDTLAIENYSYIAAEDAETALKLLAKSNDVGLIVSDVNMGEMSGHDLLQQVKSQYPHIPVLLMTAYASIRDSVDAIRQGAIDYLVKPFEPKALTDIVAKYLEGKDNDGDNAPIARAPSSQQLLKLANRMAQTDSTVLIVGESGTGKEVLARYIHQQSPRAAEPFIAINCAAIPENMLEAMLFGHEKGAYTGAYASAPGKFEQANGGTLLLDEISEMDLGLQAKLLRVLQEQEVERLGGRKTIELDVRVIATSNRNMQQQIANGQFREDLYYRLSVLPLQWQALRDRREDILPLANKLLIKHAQKQNRQGVQLAECAQKALFQHSWPGNVRELDNVIQRALILQPGENILEQDLGLDMLMPSDQQVTENSNPSADIGVHNSSNAAMHSSGMNNLDGMRETGDVRMPEHYQEKNTILYDRNNQLGDDLKQREFEIIVDTLREEKGSRKNTAERLGISPRTLRYKLARMRDIGFNIDSMVDMV